jgi:soluble lytic murein transglycosylase-like protein
MGTSPTPRRVRSPNPAFLSTPYRFFLNFAANRRMVAPAMRAALARLRPIWPILAPLGLAACGGNHRLAQSPGTERFYTAPGPASDPWRPYIQEASARFHVPGGWIRAIIRQESGGHEYLHGRPVTSDAGAMGLMQLMPATYAELRDRFGLGNDPYDPHDNIMAGTGYIAELYARYGAPAFLVAYDAGPRRMDEYNAGRGTLPNETVAYLASVAPALAKEGPMTGPLAAYAQAGGARRAPVQVYAAYTRSLGACWRDPDAAYDPDDPCNRKAAPSSAPVIATAEPGATTRAGTVIWGSALSASPSTPSPVSRPTPPRHYAAASSRFSLIPAAQAEPVRMSAIDARWGVQVGAFADPTYAREVAQSAQHAVADQLASARVVLGETSPSGGQVLYRARLEGITQPAANLACVRLTAHRWQCLTVPPGG